MDFDDIQARLMKLHASADAAEAHGTLCGLLVGRRDFATWIDYTLENKPDSGDVLAREQLVGLKQLFEATRDQLNSSDLDFELLLPDEYQDFGERLAGLGAWCQGFLYGLAVQGEQFLSGLSEQGRECMDDLLQISQLSHDEDQTEDAENDYAEIVEHVRLSVIYMNEEINPVQPAPVLQ